MKNIKREYQRTYSKGDTKRGENLRAVLGVLKEGSLATLELLDLFFGAHQRSYKSALGIVDYKRIKKQTQREIELEEMQVFYTLLNKLKRERLVVKKQSKMGSLWNITKWGIQKLNFLQKQNQKQLKYPIESEKKFKIIAFDIPETEKRKRAWLRGALKFLDFKMLQKSVWIGKNKLPEDFLLDLRDGGIMKYIHILEIGARGTVKEI